MNAKNLMLFVGMGLTFIFVLIYFLAEKKMKKKKRMRFSDRQSISLDQFYDNYYKNTDIAKDTVRKVLLLVSSSTDIPMEKIRPSDRFDDDLKPIEGWEFDDGLHEISWEIKEILNRNANKKMPNIETVDELIVFFQKMNH